MLEIFGWLGAVLFTIAGMPQAVQCHKQKHARGVSGIMLILWFTACFSSLIYSIPTKQWPLATGYATSLLSISIISYYKLFPRR